MARLQTVVGLLVLGVVSGCGSDKPSDHDVRTGVETRATLTPAEPSPEPSPSPAATVTCGRGDPQCVGLQGGTTNPLVRGDTCTDSTYQPPRTGNCWLITGTTDVCQCAYIP
jgi:hypothetical protein